MNLLIIIDSLYNKKDRFKLIFFYQRKYIYIYISESTRGTKGRRLLLGRMLDPMI